MAVVAFDLMPQEVTLKNTSNWYIWIHEKIENITETKQDTKYMQVYQLGYYLYFAWYLVTLLVQNSETL